MKIFSIIIIASVFSLACPNLDGTYLCLKNSYRKDTHYTFKLSSTADGRSLYSMKAQPVGQNIASDYEFIADGIPHDVVDKISGQKLRLRGQCQGNVLIVAGSTQLPNQPLIEFSEELSLTANRDLSNVSLDIKGNTVSEICELVEPLN